MQEGIHFSNTLVRSVHIGDKEFERAGDLAVPENAFGLVMFVHGSGSSRYSPRNRAVAESLNQAGLATLLFDLLTADEEAIDLQSGELRFDVDLLTSRVLRATDWLRADEETKSLPIGYFGASTGAAAALVAASKEPTKVGAVVSRGGRPDLAGEALAAVQAPTLLIVGGDDLVVLDLNQQAALAMTCQKELRIIPGASHLFEERGALEQVAALARGWFERYLQPDKRTTTRKPLQF